MLCVSRIIIVRGLETEKIMAENTIRQMFALVLVVGLTDFALAGPPHGAGRSYPLVYGATGRPYGPTQAHYQYELRYGRPWSGGGHRSHSSYYAGGLSFWGGSAQYLSPYGYGGYAPVYGLNTPLYATPNVIYSGPIYPQFGAYGLFGEIPGVPTINHVPFQNGVGGQTMIGQGFQPDPFQPHPEQFNRPVNPEPVIESATPEQRERALRLRVAGDEAFAKTDYRTAGELYREAMNAALDQADARYRFAISLAARSRFDEAVDQLKIATELDINWPGTGVTLDEMYALNEERDLDKLDEKNRVKTRVAEWTNRDVRDPNRLFLLAAVMQMDGDLRAKGLLETAIRLNGVERHLVAFLRPMIDETSTLNHEPLPTPAKPLIIEPGKSMVPPLPEPQQIPGEIVGEERQRRVFEKLAESIPDVPELVPPAPPQPNPPLPELSIPDPSELTPESLSNRPAGPDLPPRP